MFKMASHRGLKVNQPMGSVKATAIPMAPRHMLFGYSVETEKLAGRRRISVSSERKNLIELNRRILFEVSPSF